MLFVEEKFNSTKNLKRHGKVHEIQRCQDCGKNFNAKRDLKLHKREHNKKKTTPEHEVWDHIKELGELDDEALDLL